MKKLKTIIYFCFIASICYSQNIEVQFSETFKNPSKSQLTEILGQDDRGIYVERLKRGNLFSSGTEFMDFYDNNLKQVFSQEIPYPKDEMYSIYSEVLNDTLFMFIEYFDKEKNINYLYGTYYKNDGTLDPNFAELAAVEVEGRRKLNRFSVFRSDDSTKYLISIIPHYERRSDSKVHFIVVDHRYREYDQVRVEFPIQQRDFDLRSLRLSSNGDIHLLTSVKVERDADGKKQKNVRKLQLFTYYKADKSLHEYPIDINENYISAQQMRVLSDGNVIMTGYYSDNKKNTMKGVFFMKIDPSKKAVVNLKTTDFTEDFLALFMSKRKAKKGRELANFRIRNVYIKPDGGIQLLTEYYHYYVRVTQDANGNIRETHHYNYGDILVVDMDDSGKVNWWTKIPKMQFTINDGGYYSGMSYYFINNKIHLIYNEHEKNINEVDPDRLRNIHKKKSWTVLVTIDDQGNVEKIPLFKAKDKRLLLIPKSGSKISDNEQIFVSDAAFGKIYRLCRIRFN